MLPMVEGLPAQPSCARAGGNKLPFSFACQKVVIRSADM